MLTGENSRVVDQHIADLTAQLTEIVRDGVESGSFAAADPATTARALFQATGRFHDPGYHRAWEQPGIDTEFEAVLELVLRGLRA